MIIGYGTIQLPQIMKIGQILGKEMKIGIEKQDTYTLMVYGIVVKRDLTDVLL